MNDATLELAWLSNSDLMSQHVCDSKGTALCCHSLATKRKLFEQPEKLRCSACEKLLLQRGSRPAALTENPTPDQLVEILQKIWPKASVTWCAARAVSLHSVARVADATILPTQRGVTKMLKCLWPDCEEDWYTVTAETLMSGVIGVPGDGGAVRRPKKVKRTHVQLVEMATVLDLPQRDTERVLGSMGLNCVALYQYPLEDVKKHWPNIEERLDALQVPR